MTTPVAQLRYLTRATRNSAEDAQPAAQRQTGGAPRKVLTGAELRAQLRTQPQRNAPATEREAIKAPVAHNEATLATAQPVAVHADVPPIADTERSWQTELRRQRVLAILAEHPDLRYAVVTGSDAEPNTVVVHIGIRGLASDEVVIAKARYDGAAFLRALDVTTTGATLRGEDNRGLLVHAETAGGRVKGGGEP